VDPAVLRRLCAHGEIADLIWQTPDDLAAEHRRAFDAAILAFHAGNTERAERLWQEVETIWSHARAASYSALKLLQHSGITRFAPVKPQRWVVASFEHHCGPHGLPDSHIHNIVVARLTTG
jgi:hypothetical protein